MRPWIGAVAGVNPIIHAGHCHTSDQHGSRSDKVRVSMRKFIGYTGICLASSDAAMAQGLPAYTGSHFPVLLWFIGAGVLGLVIAYGIMRNRSRTRAEKQRTDDATRALYRSEERKRRM